MLKLFAPIGLVRYATSSQNYEVDSNKLKRKIAFLATIEAHSMANVKSNTNM